MSVRYQPEPIFEMLVERMNKDGIQCVIKTYDPMISAATVATMRSLGDAPISVVHQNLSDLNTAEEHDQRNSSVDPDKIAILSVASRFKLVEALIWTKSLHRIRRTNAWLLGIFSVLGLLGISALIVFEQIPMINQFWFVLWGVIANLTLVLATLVKLPKKQWFSVDACRAEWEKKQQREAREQEKKKGKK